MLRLRRRALHLLDEVGAEQPFRGSVECARRERDLASCSTANVLNQRVPVEILVEQREQDLEHLWAHGRPLFARISFRDCHSQAPIHRPTLYRVAV